MVKAVGSFYAHTVSLRAHLGRRVEHQRAAPHVERRDDDDDARAAAALVVAVVRVRGGGGGGVVVAVDLARADRKPLRVFGEDLTRHAVAPHTSDAPRRRSPYL